MRRSGENAGSSARTSRTARAQRTSCPISVKRVTPACATRASSPASGMRARAGGTRGIVVVSQGPPQKPLHFSAAMPLPVNVQSGTRRSVRGLIGRVLQRPVHSGRHVDPPAADSRVDLAGAAVIDADTRTFWARGDAPVATEDASPGPSKRSEARERISALLHAHETGN